MKSLIAFAFVTLLSQTAHAGPVLCSSADGKVFLTADLQGEGNLEDVRVTINDWQGSPQVQAGSFFMNKEFSFKAQVALPEESVNLSVKTTSAKGTNVLTGELREQAGESNSS